MHCSELFHEDLFKIFIDSLLLSCLNPPLWYIAHIHLIIKVRLDILHECTHALFSVLPSRPKIKSMLSKMICHKQHPVSLGVDHALLRGPLLCILLCCKFSPAFRHLYFRQGLKASTSSCSHRHLGYPTLVLGLLSIHRPGYLWL